MFAMSQHQYTYAATQAPPRQYPSHGTSSAFSSSANPDEDWTKISDLAERRRIQNRIAQRNYRKKLKRRLEDLERRANTSDGSPPASGPEKQTTSKNVKKSPVKTQKATPAPQKPVPAPQFTPPMTHEDEMMFPSPYDDRERSHTPPYIQYSSYPPPDEMLLPPYGTAQPYQAMTTAEAYPSYMATTMPSTLPSITHFNDAIKRESYPEESLSPYMNYGFLPSIDMSGQNPYDSSNPHVSHVRHHSSHHHHR